MNDYDRFLFENEKNYLDKALELAVWSIDLYKCADRSDRPNPDELLDLIKAQVRICQNIIQNDLIP
jgi:hypothetical protein